MNYFSLLHNVTYKVIMDNCNNDAERAGKLFEKIIGYKYEGPHTSRLVRVSVGDMFREEEG